MDANSILQSYNKATGSSSTPQYKPTGKPKVDSILSSYYSASAKIKEKPTVTPAPKKVATTPVKKVAATPIVKQAPQTGVQKALKTLGDVSQQAQNVVKTIGKGIEVTFVKPKVISPVPEKVIQQKKQQAQGPVQIKPGQTKLTKTQMSGFAQMTNNITSQIPATIKSAKEYVKDPLNIGKLNNKGQAESRKAAAEGFNDIKSAFIEAVNRSAKAKFQKAPLKEKAIQKVESVTGVVNLLFSPIGAGFKVANTIPIVSAVTKALSLPFEALGEGVPKITNSAVDSLPISKNTKARIKPVVAEATTIVAMLALGKATEIGGEKLKSTIKTVGADNFERLTKNVIETSGSAKTYNLTRDQVRDIYRGLGDKDAVDAFKQLGVSDRVKAVKEGITLDIPTEKIVRIVDKPYWEKIKTILGKELTNKEVVTKGAATARPGFAGYLTDGQHTPQEVVGAVIKAGEEKTVEGKATIKAALEAQKSGHNIEIKQVKENKKDPYVYHETKDSNLESIAKNGLQKSPGQYGNAVYTAGTIAETKGYGSEGDTILRIKRDNLPSDFQEFPEQGWTTKTIPPQYLEVSKDNGKTWQFLQEQTIPQIERAKDYTSAKDFATEVYSAQPSNQIGLVDPKTIEIRDNVDPTSAEYKKLKSDIEKNGIKEPIRVTVDDKPLTTDGSNRTAIARELGIKVPVIVNSGEIKGLSTIEGIYKEKYPKTEITDKVLKENKIISVPAIGTPKLAQGVRNNAIKNKIIYGFDKTFRDLPEYDRVDVKDQGNKAVELVLSDPNRAFRIAMGQEQPPSSLLPESVFVALEKYATETKNIDVLRQLATQSSLTSQATGMGQRIRMLAERNPHSPTKIMGDAVKIKEKIINKRFSGRSPQNAVRSYVERGKKTLNKSKEHIDKNDWGSLIDEIKCK